MSGFEHVTPTVGLVHAFSAVERHSRPQPPASRTSIAMFSAAAVFHLVAFVAGVVLLEGASAAPPRASTAEYLLLPGHGRYKINASYKTWEAAKSTCEGEDAHLAVLDSEEEMDAVLNMLVRSSIQDTRYDFWTGYFRQEETGQWTTVIGWPVGSSNSGYTGWMSGYPNGVRDAACSRLLLTINARGLINGDCTNVGPFICEKDYEKEESELDSFP